MDKEGEPKQTLVPQPPPRGRLKPVLRAGSASFAPPVIWGGEMKTRAFFSFLGTKNAATTLLAFVFPFPSSLPGCRTEALRPMGWDQPQLITLLLPPMPKRNQRGKHPGCLGFNPSVQGVQGRACPVLGCSHAEGSAPRLALSLVLTWLHASDCYSPPVSVTTEVIYIHSCKLGAAGSWLR